MNSKAITLQVGTKIILKNVEGKFLFLHRNLKKYPEVKGAWDIVGGRIMLGTTLLENLKREVLEETGLILKEEPKILAVQDILRIPGRQVVRLTFIGRAEGEVKLDFEENDAYEWYALSELKSLDDIDMYVKLLLDNGTITE